MQRTKRIDDAESLLLKILEDLTSGTEEETKKFMAECVASLKTFSTNDLVTPLFVFERLNNMILPEKSDDVSFYLQLDKDPQQEEFLQGRMQGNPYKSSEPGLGPLMRDIKNKICTGLCCRCRVHGCGCRCRVHGCGCRCRVHVCDCRCGVHVWLQV